MPRRPRTGCRSASRDRQPATRTRHSSRTKSTNSTMPPMNPSSSARVANTKSVAWTGRKSPCVWVPFVRPLPTSPPGPDGDLGLVELEAGALDVGRGVEEGLESRLLVVAQEVGPRDRDHRHDADGQDRQPAEAGARHPEHPGEDRGEHERGAEVRLEHHQGERRPDEQAGADRAAGASRACPAAPPGSWPAR